MILLRWLRISLHGSLTVSLIVLPFMDLFLYSDSIICSTIAFFPLGNSDHVVSASIMTFCQTQNRWPVSWHSFYDYSRGDWDGLGNHLRDVPGKDIFKLSTSAAASEFCKWLQVGLDVYIRCHKYQVTPHSSAKIVNWNQLHIIKSIIKSAFLQEKNIFLRIVIQIQVFSFPYFKKY